MELTIHSYGYAETIFRTLNALAMLRNSALYPAMIQTVTLSVGVFYAWKMAAASRDGEWRQYIMKILGMVFLVNALLLPKTSMNIKDHVEKHFWRVDNIPLAFALPIGTIESLGHLVTMAFEQAFASVDGKSGFNYYHYGSVFGARLARQVMQAKVRDPEFVSNMNHFIGRCVVMPAMIGQQFTKEELVATKDMWGLVSKNAGTFTRTPMTINGVKQYPSPTCKQAVPYFEKIMDSSGRADITSFSWKFKAAGPAKKYNQGYKDLNNNLKAQINAVFNDATKVEDILRHNMLINALNDYRAGKYPAAKAMMHHEAGGLLSGDIAEHVLTSWLAVMKNLVYSSFVFLVPLMLITGGMSKYRGWLTICLSLQLWPPLFAVLNMLIDYAYEPAKIVSYSAWSTEMHKFDSMASVAANLTLLIPFLAVWVTRMGEGGFMHMAGSIMATASTATAAAASEKTSGGMSYDNTSIGNVSRSNVSAGKYDDTQQFVTGGQSISRGDGSMEKVLPNGGVISVAGAGTTSSVGEVSARESDSMTTSLHQGRRDEMQAMTSESASWSKTKESLFSQETAALKTIAENTRTDNGYSIDTSTDSGKEVVRGLNAIDRLTESNEYSWEQNAEAYIKGDASFGASLPKFLGIKAGVDAGVGGKVGAGNSSRQYDGFSAENFSESNTHERSGHGSRSNNQSSYLESIGIDKAQQQQMRETYNEAQRLEESVNAHKDNIESYNEALEYTKTHANEFSRDMVQDVIDGYKERYGVSDGEASREVARGSSGARQIFAELGQARANEVLEKVRSGKANIASSTIVDDIATQHQDSISQTPGGQDSRVQEFADSNGMRSESKVSDITQQISGAIKEEHQDRLSGSKANYEAAHTINEQEQSRRQETIATHEENRIGRGKASRLLGGAANVASLGNAGWGIGRPEAENQENMPEFEPMIKKYGEDTKYSNLESMDAKKPIQGNSDSSVIQNVIKQSVKQKPG